jgi:hypothetical protein
MIDLDGAAETIETVTVRATRLPGAWLTLAIGLGVLGLALILRATR